MGFSLFLGLPHGLSGKPVHFLGCGDGRHFDAQTAKDFRKANVSPRSNETFPLLFLLFASTLKYGARLLSKSYVILMDHTWSLGIRVSLSPKTASLGQLVF